VQIFYFYDARVATSSSGLTLPGGAYYRAFVPRALLPDPVVPQLGPPLAPLINGKDAFQFQAGVGAQPVISWSPPALGTASKYLLGFEQFKNAFKTNEVATVTFVLYDRTSLKLPAGTLAANGAYVGNLVAVSSPDRMDDAVLGLGSPNYQAVTIFGSFTP
jgi:hypothetical protein